MSVPSSVFSYSDVGVHALGRLAKLPACSPADVTQCTQPIPYLSSPPLRSSCASYGFLGRTMMGSAHTTSGDHKSNVFKAVLSMCSILPGRQRAQLPCIRLRARQPPGRRRPGASSSLQRQQPVHRATDHQHCRSRGPRCSGR